MKPTLSGVGLTSRVPRPRGDVVSLRAENDGAWWELTNLLGEGRWSQVWAARRIGDGEAECSYALKIALPEDRSQDAAIAQAMLRREAAVSTEVSHCNLVPVLHSRFATSESYLVLPRLRGASARAILAHRRREYGCLIGASKCMSQSIGTVRQMASALEALHAKGWLHGDIKPENVLVSRQGHTCLIDLGLARRLDRAECAGGEILTATLGYVSPEMILAQGRLSAASDIYSLGIMLYELLAGEHPFGECDSTQLALAHVRSVPQDIREFSLDVPPRLAQLLQRMLAKEPLRRPGAKEVVREFTRLEIESLATCQRS